MPEPAAALGELRRVLRPDAELRFLEHVRSDRSPKARLQGWVDRSGIWGWFAGGCHCARDTLSEIETTGFEIERVERFDLGPSWLITNPHMLGVARSQATAG